MEAKDGFVKLLADPVTGEIIGGCCVGPYGGDLIHEIIAAMYKRMTVTNSLRCALSSDSCRNLDLPRRGTRGKIARKS